MNNELIVPGSQPSLLEIRMDSKKYPRLCRYSKEDADRAMVTIVSKAFLYRGQTADPSVIGFTASALVDELLQEDKYGAKYLSMEEISRIIKKAVLESDIFISVSSLYKVILDFCKGEGTRIQQEAAALKRKQDEESLRNSVVAPMLQAYTGAFIKEHTVK